MTYKFVYHHIDGQLTADISSVATLMPLDAATLATLSGNVNFVLGEWTYLTLDNGVYAEDIKITGLSAGYAVVTRGQSGSTPQNFAAVDTAVTCRINSAAVADIVAANPSPSDTTVTGTGQAEVVKTGDNYNVHVEIPTFTGEDGIQVLGAWPLLTIGLESGACGCCGDGSGSGGGSGGGGITEVQIQSTILQGEVTDGVLTLGLTEPEFTGSDGIAVTGEWPNFNIGLPGGGGGGGGTVLSVGVGTGLSLVGNPNINPVISLTNTGVTAGSYAGMAINAQGQITGLPVGFNPISVINVDYGNVTRTGITANITLDHADIGTPGIVPLADHTDPVDSGDTTSAVTPALLAAALGGTDTYFGGSSTGEADGLYTNALLTTQITVNVPSGKKLLLIGDVIILNDSTPATPIEFGIAVFNTSGAALWKQKKATQSQQTILGVVSGPINATIGIATTALTGATVQSASLAGVIF